MSTRHYKTLQQRGREVLDFITTYYNRNFKSPTYDEIIARLDIKSKSHLNQIIDYLVLEGLLERQENIPRGLRIPGWSPPSGIQIHHKGYIAANNLNPLIVLDEFDSESTIEISLNQVPKNTLPSDLFALTVQGDSMEDALIADGDLIILKKGEAWNDGDTVAVWLENEQAITLKQLYRGEENTVKLKPRSHKHHIRVEKQCDIRVMGRLAFVFRKVPIH